VLFSEKTLYFGDFFGFFIKEELFPRYKHPPKGLEEKILRYYLKKYYHLY